jgi:hypothetical protein
MFETFCVVCKGLVPEDGLGEARRDHRGLLDGRELHPALGHEVALPVLLLEHDEHGRPEALEGHAVRRARPRGPLVLRFTDAHAALTQRVAHDAGGRACIGVFDAVVVTDNAMGMGLGAFSGGARGGAQGQRSQRRGDGHREGADAVDSNVHGGLPRERDCSVGMCLEQHACHGGGDRRVAL